MIKIGDKVICVKEYIIYTCNTRIRIFKHTYEENKIYEVVKISKNECSACISEENGGIWFNITEDSLYLRHSNLKKFSDYFLTLAELREKQIKTVLND